MLSTRMKANSSQNVLVMKDCISSRQVGIMCDFCFLKLFGETFRTSHFIFYFFKWTMGKLHLVALTKDNFCETSPTADAGDVCLGFFLFCFILNKVKAFTETHDKAPVFPLQCEVSKSLCKNRCLIRFVMVTA